ncbi:MAG: hypothetical protein OEM46_08170, partial [Ignavibacteria bacterium]|nr:hypothetical protein [Ignavibacteria bacterium]
MIELLVYLLKSSIIIVVLYGFYQLVLARDHCHRRNRFFLISSYFIALILPSITFNLMNISADLYNYSVSVTDIDKVFNAEQHSQSVSVVLSNSDVIALLYLSGCLILFGLFIYRLLRLFVIIRAAPIKKCVKITFVYLEHIPSP